MSVTYPFSDLLGAVGGFLHVALPFGAAALHALLEGINLSHDTVLVVLEVSPEANELINGRTRHKSVFGATRRRQSCPIRVETYISVS